MAAEFDAIADLERRLEQLELLISKDILNVKFSGTDPFLLISSRLDRLQTALEQQQQALQDFVRAHIVRDTNDLAQCVPPVPNLSVPAIKLPLKDNQDAATQTPLAQTPPVAPPLPPPIRVRALGHHPKIPSPLRRSSSTESGQHQLVAREHGSVLRPSLPAQKNTAGLNIPRSPGIANQKTLVPAKLDECKQTESTNQISAPNSNGVGLRERRAAFAALQSFAPLDKASKHTSLAISAAQRELIRAAARAKEDANREREESGGLLAWVGFVLLVIGGIGATLLGVIAMTMKAE